MLDYARRRLKQLKDEFDPSTTALGRWLAIVSVSIVFVAVGGVSLYAVDMLRAQADAQGRLGYRYKGVFVFKDGCKTIYVKATKQSARFSYQALPYQTSASAFIAQANNEGALGWALLGEMFLGSSFYEVFVQPQNCTGYLCGALNPMTQD